MDFERAEGKFYDIEQYGSDGFTKITSFECFAKQNFSLLSIFYHVTEIQGCPFYTLDIKYQQNKEQHFQQKSLPLLNLGPESDKLLVNCNKTEFLRGRYRPQMNLTKTNIHKILTQKINPWMT